MSSLAQNERSGQWPAPDQRRPVLGGPRCAGPPTGTIQYTAAGDQVDRARRLLKSLLQQGLGRKGVFVQPCAAETGLQARITRRGLRERFLSEVLASKRICRSLRENCSTVRMCLPVKLPLMRGGS